MVLTDPGSVPPNWNLDFDAERGETAPLTSSEFSSQMNSQQSVALGNTANPRARYCRKCNQLKPPRCHHCSVCKYMDQLYVLPAVMNQLISFLCALPLHDFRWKMCS